MQIFQLIMVEVQTIIFRLYINKYTLIFLLNTENQKSLCLNPGVLPFLHPSYISEPPSRMWGNLHPCTLVFGTSRLGILSMWFSPTEMNSILPYASWLETPPCGFHHGQHLSANIWSKINKFWLHLFQLTLDAVFFKRKTDQGQSFGKENPINIGYHDHHGNFSTLTSSGHSGSWLCNPQSSLQMTGHDLYDIPK